MQGDIKDFSVKGIFNFMFDNKRSGIFYCQTPFGLYEVYFKDGSIIYSSRNGIFGESAIFLLFYEKDGSFDIKPFQDPPSKTLSISSVKELEVKFNLWDKKRNELKDILVSGNALYFWSSKLEKDASFLSRESYDVVSLIRERALSLLDISKFLKMDMIDAASILNELAKYDFFEQLEITRPLRKSEYKVLVTSRDPILMENLWKNLSKGIPEVPFVWDKKGVYYKLLVTHIGYSINLIFLTQYIDEEVFELIRDADILFFLSSPTYQDEEDHYKMFTQLNPNLLTFFFGKDKKEWVKNLKQSVFRKTPINKEKILEIFDIFV